MFRFLMITVFICGVFSIASSQSTTKGEDPMKSNSTDTTQAVAVFATFAETEEQYRHALILAESIRKFAGNLHDAPVWIYTPEGSPLLDGGWPQKAAAFDAVVKTSTAPEDALWFYYARKVFAAAAAEAAATNHADILIWMDEDTIVLEAPLEFMLKPNHNLAYRPVMHQNIGSLYDEPLDAFWSRVYDKLSVPDAAVFPMQTPADRKILRPYFNAGILVVRPERGLLRHWAECFPVLYQDRVFREMCEQDHLKRIFLHQAALTGAILNQLKPEEMTELSARVNYPIFFKAMFGAVEEFDNLDGVVTLRYDAYFRNPDPNWAEKLRGEPTRIEWLKLRLADESK